MQTSASGISPAHTSSTPYGFNEGDTGGMPSFDVFVSYSRAAQYAAEQLGRALRARGLTVFVDRW
jgi:hypothetical protein